MAIHAGPSALARRRACPQLDPAFGRLPGGKARSLPHLPEIEWNDRDEMASTDKGNGELVYFTYDSVGQRVRKVYEHNGLIEERIYLGGFEIYRRWQAPTETSPKVLKLERETLHVMDGERRIALVETKTVDVDAGGAFQVTTVTRLQLGNHLGSAALEVQLDGAVISYEEYHPYGTTAYQSASSAVEVSRKRYRYTGKERDEETGLYYHGARYYAPWLGRWTAADPAGLVDGPGLYTYVGGKPIILVDPNGKDGKAAGSGEDVTYEYNDPNHPSVPSGFHDNAGNVWLWSDAQGTFVQRVWAAPKDDPGAGQTMRAPTRDEESREHFSDLKTRRMYAGLADPEWVLSEVLQKSTWARKQTSS